MKYHRYTRHLSIWCYRSGEYRLEPAWSATDISDTLLLSFLSEHRRQRFYFKCD